MSRLVRLFSMRITDFDMELYFETNRLLDGNDDNVSVSIGGRDGSILAIMKKHKVKTIVTHDSDFMKLADKGIIQVFDPILSRRK